MFLYDSEAQPDIPAEAGRSPVMHTPSCLAFSVLIYVDGDAKIILCNNSDVPYCTEYYSGTIECASKAISLYDHNGFAFASVPLTDGFARVSLRMSEPTNPDIVECVIQNMLTF